MNHLMNFTFKNFSIFLLMALGVNSSEFLSGHSNVQHTENLKIYPVNEDSNITVETIIMYHSEKYLQLKINWPKLSDESETIHIDIKPLENVGDCEGKACFEYGILGNTTEILLPRASQFIEYSDCPIRPGCSYELKIYNTNNKLLNEQFSYDVPECVGEKLKMICLCNYTDQLPKVDVAVTSIKANEVDVVWNVNSTKRILHNSLNQDYEVLIRVIKYDSENIHSYSEFTIIGIFEYKFNQKNIKNNFKNNTQTIHLTQTLCTNNSIEIIAIIKDSRNCEGSETNIFINAPDFGESKTNLIFIGLPIILLALLLTFGVLVIIKRSNFMKKEANIAQLRGIYKSVSSNNIVNIMMEDNFLYVDKDIMDARMRGDADYYEVPHSCLHIGSEIGKGAFGRVFIARADNMGNKLEKRLVAVKQLKKRPTVDELDEFLGEIETMKKVGYNPNVVSFLGCCTIRQPFLMVMEYVGCGDLLQYLRKIRGKHEERAACVSGIEKINMEMNNNVITQQMASQQQNKVAFNGKYLEIGHSSSSSSSLVDGSYITHPETQPPHQVRPSVTETLYTVLSQDGDAEITSVANSLEYVLDHNELHNFAMQISRGMRHLEEKNITHRDLAARNILIDENKTLKISDFGLSRQGIYVNTKNKKVPLRWLSIEAIRDNLYSNQSDVWAFGIVLWEIGTLGGFPYPNVGNHELLSYLASGQRLQRPENCSTFLYDIMCKCWCEFPNDRPTFQDIVTKLEPHKQRIYIDFEELGPDYVFPPTDEKILES